MANSLVVTDLLAVAGYVPSESVERVCEQALSANTKDKFDLQDYPGGCGLIVQRFAGGAPRGDTSAGRG